MVNPNIRRKDGHPFYAELQSFDDFEAVSDLTRYTPAPDDWLVVIADIKGSTQAISEGRYKDVNMVGAACITAVLNVTRNHEISYVFGGDGATLMVPPDTLPRVRDALLKTRNLAQSGFGLTLRVGAVPVSRVRRDHIDVLVAKYCLSPGNYLAMFAGGGVGLVDKLVKEDDGTQGYVLADDAGNEEPDLEGLSCRWEPLAAQRGVMLSMLIQALAEDRTEAATTYRRVIAGLTEALGYDPQQNRPVQADNMKFRWPPSGLKAEARATQGGGGYGWRLVLDCSPDEVAAMEAALVGLRSEGLIAYGLHEADSALMTCLVFNLTDSEHVHFIDGADGGFAMAARQLKQQLADRLLDA